MQQNSNSETAVFKSQRKGDFQTREDERVKNFFEVVKPGRKFESYLDIGCGGMEITHTLAEKLSISKYFGTDIFDSDMKNYVKSNGMHYTFADNSFDLITCYVSIHHMENLAIFFSEINRMLKPDGVLFVREHNANTHSIYPYLNFVHLVDDVFRNGELKEFKNFYATYMSREDLKEILRRIGLIEINYGAYEASSNPQRLYFASFGMSKRKPVVKPGNDAFCLTVNGENFDFSILKHITQRSPDIYEKLRSLKPEEVQKFLNKKLNGHPELKTIIEKFMGWKE